MGACCSIVVTTSRNIINEIIKNNSPGCIGVESMR